MVDRRADIVVAGHICVDVLPVFAEHTTTLDTLFIPGTLVEVGPAIVTAGGAVSNTGLALHRLGVPTRLMGKVGTDLFGDALLGILRAHDEALARGMIVGQDKATSYTIVISPPGVDRIFLHCSGANDSFTADDVDMSETAGARMFHFGYPPLMRRMYLDRGTELATLMQRAKAVGLTTSLDMAFPDPNSEAGRIDWAEILTRVLPYVDLCLPSFDELLFMLDRPRFDALRDRDKQTAVIDGVLLGTLAERLLDMGVAMAVLKLGDQGLYLRTTSSAERLTTTGIKALPRNTGWLGRELLAPCFKVQIAGTTGAGDCTIAGFLAGLLKGLDIEDVMAGAVAVGACSVESPDATGGVPDWDTVQRRVKSGWARHDITLPLHGWHWEARKSIWIGPHDQAC